MRKSLYLVCFGSVVLAFAFSATASSIIPLGAEQSVRVSDAICRGTVLNMSCFKATDGLIYTRTSVRVDEPLKGTFPSVVAVVHRGGQVGNEDELFGLSPRFALNGEYLLFIIRGGDGSLRCVQGAASAIRLDRATDPSVFVPEDEALLDEVRDLTWNGQLPGANVTDQEGSNQSAAESLVGMLNGTPSRFLQPDRGEGIPYLIDTNSLPAGMSVAQATNAVLTALNAWKAVTSVQFRFEGFQTFGQGADTVAINDDKLRIQLHDTYNSTGGGNTLGVGGRNASSSPLPGIGWNIGGNVAGTEFWRTRRGYVVLNSANVAMQNLSTFTEVLCHEIGHAINLAHSSENPSESDPVLKQAIMYYQAHADGRGAALGSYDVPVIQQIYPTNNTPPFTFSRVMDIVMAAPQPASPINTIDLRGYDLQSNTLTLIMTNVTAGNGDFSKAGSFIHFTPRFFFVDSERLDPGDPASAFDRFDARYSDGTNASPYISVRVISFSGDDDSPSDGIPDNWMLTYFGHADPRANDLTLATSDKDGDRLTNLQEYRAGMDPTSAASAQKITLFNTGLLQVQVKPYELYELHGTTNFVNWIRVGSPFIPTNAIGSVSNFIDPTFSRRFYRVYKVQ